MRHSARLTTLSLVSCLVGVAACGGDSTTPIVPASLAIAGGDAQLGLFGDTLPLALAVTVTGSDGRVFPGATVAWAAAPAGAASFLPSTSTSDAGGRASTVVALGSTAGALSVTATVTGLPPASFGLQVVDPCNFLRPYTVGDTATGVLATRDCRLNDGSSIDFYGTTNAVAQWWRISLTSTAFDAYLFLFDTTGFPVAVSDDEDSTTTNAAIRILAASGPYVIGANSFFAGQTGPYSIASAPALSNVTDCADVWLTRGVQTDQQIEITDCGLNGFYRDPFGLVLRAGQSVTIAQSSTAVDAYLELYNGAGALVASDDNGGGGSDALLTYTPTASDLYVVWAGTFSMGETGPYTLSVSAAPGAAASGVAGFAGPARAPSSLPGWWAAAIKAGGASRPAKLRHARLPAR
jgi:hypothetical protein